MCVAVGWTGLYSVVKLCFFLRERFANFLLLVHFKIYRWRLGWRSIREQSRAVSCCPVRILEGFRWSRILELLLKVVDFSETKTGRPGF